MKTKTRLGYMYERMIDAGVDLKELNKQSGVTMVTLTNLNKNTPSINTLIKLGIVLKDNNFVNKMRELPGEEAENKN